MYKYALLHVSEWTYFCAIQENIAQVQECGFTSPQDKWNTPCVGARLHEIQCSKKFILYFKW